MKKELFEEFKEYVKETFDREVFKTTPEKAVTVGSFEITLEQPPVC